MTLPANLKSGFELIVRFSSSNGSFYRSFTSVGIENVSVPANIRGVWVGSLLSGVSDLYFNGAIRSSSAPGAVTHVPTSNEIFIFGAASNNSSKLLSAASIGKGFTASEHVAVNTIFQQARTARSELAP
jgi:hypothetical protein